MLVLGGAATQSPVLDYAMNPLRIGDLPRQWPGRGYQARGDVVRLSVFAMLIRSLAAAVVLAASAGASMAGNVEGSWRTDGGTEVTVVPCGSQYCGYLSWIVIPPANRAQCSANRELFASEMLDYQNPNKALQGRSIIGLQMMTIKPTTSPNSFKVRVYNVQDGSTNDADLFVLNGGNTLRIGGGCIGTTCIQSFDWPRVPVRPGPPDFTCGG